MTTDRSGVLATKNGLQVGTGPFYVILGQREGFPSVPGPNVSVWQSVSVKPATTQQVSLTITPAVITNDYVGQIALDITGLSVGMTVAVDSYADLNANGIIDAGDLLTGSLLVTDGQAPLVAGARNLNVPGDDDGSANGQIRVLSNFPDTGGGIWIGNSLIRVSDPAGKLTSVTQTLSVIERIYPQGIRGRVTIGGRPLTNCVLGEVGLPSITHLVLTDTNGSYALYGLPGLYTLVGLNQQGAIFNENQVASVVCGETAINDFVVTNGTVFIAGRVTDAGTGHGIPNLEVDANTPNNLVAFAYTDLAGKYSLKVLPNTWSIHPTAGGPTTRGYVDPTRTKVALLSTSISNINFALSPPTALIYGTIMDTAHNPVIGVRLDALDQPTSNFHVIGRSFATNASYSLGVLPGTWNVTPNSWDLAGQGYMGWSTNITLGAGQATNLNFVVTRTNWPILRAPVHLSPDQFQFTLQGLAGQNYSIQSTTNLETGNWSLVLKTNAPCSTIFIFDLDATNDQQFYRAERSH